MQQNLNIVRDCYWVMPSGDRYMRDEGGNLSTAKHGLYKSFNANDNEYVVASDSGNIQYYGRLESTNLSVDSITLNLRAQCVPEGSAVLSINNSDIGFVAVSGGINDYSQTFQLTNSQRGIIHNGRILDNYDYFSITLGKKGIVGNDFKTPDLWLNAETGTYSGTDGTGAVSDGTAVRSWKNQGVGGELWAQTDGEEYAPIYSTNIINGKPGVRFWYPSGMFLENAGKPLTSTSGSFYVVCYPKDSAAGSSYIYNTHNTGTGDSYMSVRVRSYPSGSTTLGEEPQLYWRLSSESSPQTYHANVYPSSAPLAFGITSNGTRYLDGIWINGSGYRNISTGTTNQGSWWGDVTTAISTIGAKYQGDGPAFADFGFNGYIMEIIGYEAPLSSGEKQGVENYIADTYGIGVTYVKPSMVLYDVEIAYSGNYTWDNHTTGLPNVIHSTFLPNKIKFHGDITCSGSVYDITDPITGATVDDTYIELQNQGTYHSDWVKAKITPSGFLGISFDQTATPSGLEPLQSITRAQMRLRMALPPSGDNSRDTFEINGYNARYKNQDHREELAYVNASQIPRYRGFGYFTYGAGDIIESSGFNTYTVELNFLNPNLPSGNLASTKHANADMLANTEFRLIGLPSGTQLSSAELQVEYIPNSALNLYTAGTVYRCAASSTVDAGSALSYSEGHGGWHHIGWRLRGPTVVEEDVWTNFYTFSEGAGHTRTYPETTKAYYFPTGDEDYTVYADYVIRCPRGTDGDEGDVIPLLKDPQRREYYRNPISAEDLTPAYETTPRDISTFKPHYYQHMIYHGASLNYVDVNVDDGDSTSLDSDDLCQIFFEDRIGLLENFTLYFVLYRDYGFQSYGRFFHRGLTRSEGITQYEIYGDIEPNLVRFTVQGDNGSDNKVEVEINQYTKEPILIWFSCGYETNQSGYTTMKLSVHQDTKNYFGNDWIHAEKHFVGRRKQYSSNSEIVYRPDGTSYVSTWGGPRTVIGTLDNLTVYEQMSRRLYLHRVSPVEFGYKAGVAIDLDYTTSQELTQTGYDTSAEKDKHFLSTRVANSQYMQNNPSGVRWVVPQGSGAAEWATHYNLFTFASGDLHSIFSPVSTAGTNNIVAPSAVWVELDVAHNTDHPSGMTVYVDVEFDSGTSDNWKVAHTEFNIPSGGAVWLQYSPIEYTAGVSKHINLDEGPIKFSDLENINITVTTKYPGDGENEYYGSSEIRAVNVYFDSYCIPATGINYLDLYTNGTASKPTNELDLYIVGNQAVTVDPGDNALDLFIQGIPYISNSGMPLYTHGTPSPFISPGDDQALNLYIEGLDPPEASGDFPLYMWATTNPAIRDNINMYTVSWSDPQYTLPLFIDAGTGDENQTMPLYIKNYPWVNATPSNVPLYMFNNAQTINDNLTLYTKTQAGTDGAFVDNESMPLFIARDSEAVAGRISLVINNETIGQPPLYSMGHDTQYTVNRFGVTSINNVDYYSLIDIIDNTASSASSGIQPASPPDNLPGKSVRVAAEGQYLIPGGGFIDSVELRDRSLLFWHKSESLTSSSRTIVTNQSDKDEGSFVITWDYSLGYIIAKCVVDVVSKTVTTVDTSGLLSLVNDGEFHHYSCVVDRDNDFKFYIDGSLQDSNSGVVGYDADSWEPFISGNEKIELNDYASTEDFYYYDIRNYYQAVDQNEISNIINAQHEKYTPSHHWLPNRPDHLNLFIEGSGTIPVTGPTTKLYTHGF